MLTWLRRRLSTWSMAGALWDNKLRNREFYGDHSGSFRVATGDSGVKTMLTCKAGHTIYVQQIGGDITTANSGKTLIFQDSAGTPVPLTGAVDGGTGGPFSTRDYGDDGVPLTAGKDFTVSISGAGAAALITWAAYQKLTTVGAA